MGQDCVSSASGAVYGLGMPFVRGENPSDLWPSTQERSWAEAEQSQQGNANIEFSFYCGQLPLEAGWFVLFRWGALLLLVPSLPKDEHGMCSALEGCFDGERGKIWLQNVMQLVMISITRRSYRFVDLVYYEIWTFEPMRLESAWCTVRHAD